MDVVNEIVLQFHRRYIRNICRLRLYRATYRIAALAFLMILHLAVARGIDLRAEKLVDSSSRAKLSNILQSAANFVRISTARIQADDAKQVGDTRNAAATLFAAVTATVSAMNPPPELPALVPPEKSPHEDSEGRPLPLKPGEQQARKAAAGRAVEHVSGKEKEKRKDLEKKVR